MEYLKNWTTPTYVSANMLTLYAESEGGNSYGPNYLITGVYNISGI